MPWVNDLAAGFGLPSGAATIAVALYGACKAAQGAARREAIDEIGHFLDDPKWTRSIRPSQIAERIFIATFGEQHTSIQCIKRSILASLIFIGAIILVLRVDGFETRYIFAWSFWIYLPFVGIFADYMALLKTRILLRASITPVILVILDVTASVGISTVVYLVVKIYTSRLQSVFPTGNVYVNASNIYLDSGNCDIISGAKTTGATSTRDGMVLRRGEAPNRSHWYCRGRIDLRLLDYMVTCSMDILKRRKAAG